MNAPLRRGKAALAGAANPGTKVGEPVHTHSTTSASSVPGSLPTASREELVDILKMLAGERERICLAGINPNLLNAHGEATIKAKSFIDSTGRLGPKCRFEQAAQWAINMADDGYGLYWAVNPTKKNGRTFEDGGTKEYKPRNEDVLAMDYAHLDVDPDTKAHGSYAAARDHLLNVTLPALIEGGASLVFNTGNGLAAYWAYKEPLTDLELGERINRQLVAKFGGDAAAVDPSRIMRLPGLPNIPSPTKVQKKGYPNEIRPTGVLHNGGATWDPAELSASLPEPVAKVAPGKGNTAGTMKVTPLSDEAAAAVLERLLGDLEKPGNEKLKARWEGDSEGLKDDSGSGFDFSMAAMLKGRGYSFDEVCHLLKFEFEHGKGLENRDYDLSRLWSRSAVEADEPFEVVEEGEPESEEDEGKPAKRKLPSDLYAAQMEFRKEVKRRRWNIDAFRLGKMLDEIEGCVWDKKNGLIYKPDAAGFVRAYTTPNFSEFVLGDGFPFVNRKTFNSTEEDAEEFTPAATEKDVEEAQARVAEAEEAAVAAAEVAAAMKTNKTATTEEKVRSAMARDAAKKAATEARNAAKKVADAVEKRATAAEDGEGNGLKAAANACTRFVLRALCNCRQVDRQIAKVDMFATETRMMRTDNGTAVLTAHWKALVEGEADPEVVADYLEHFPELPRILRMLVAARFAADRRNAFLWLQAVASWGKGFFLDILKALDLALFIDTKELAKMMDGAPSGIDLSQHYKAWVLVFDEFKHITGDVKKINNTISGAAKNALRFVIEVFLKIFCSAEDVASLTGEAGVEAQFAERFNHLKKTGTLDEREVFQRVGKRAYFEEVKAYIAAELNRMVRETVALGRDGAALWADKVLADLHADWGLSQSFTNLADSIEAYAQEVLTSLLDIQNYKVLDTLKLGKVRMDENDQCYCILPRVDKFIDRWIRDNLADSEVVKVRYKLGQIKEHMDAMPSANGNYNLRVAWVTKHGELKKLERKRDRGLAIAITDKMAVAILTDQGQVEE